MSPYHSPYFDLIRTTLAEVGLIGAADPRHVEAYMRLEHRTLDGLSKSQFKREVEIGVACVREGGVVEAEACAASFGL